MREIACAERSALGTNSGGDAMPQTNPVVERLEQLDAQWLSFAAKPDARLLVWRAAPDEGSMVDAFAAKECELETANTPDLFLQLRAPFGIAEEHGYALIAELSSQYVEAMKGLEAGEPEHRWRAPGPRHGDDDVACLVRVLASFRSHHLEEELSSKLVIRLDPTDVSSNSAYLLWLGRLVQAAPSELRFLVVDSSIAPMCATLIKTEPARVVETVCDLNMPAVLQQLVDENGQNGPSDEFRRLQVRLLNAIRARNLDATQRHSVAATELATDHGWPHLAAAIQMMVANGFSASQQPVEALNAYGEAERFARECEAQEESGTAQPGGPFGRKLRLFTRLGQGAVLLAAGMFRQAAESYAQTAEVAKALGDERSELDCYRLASLGYAQDGLSELGWELGMRGLQLGITMDQETRENSTLVYLADHLLRMTQRFDAYQPHGRPLEEQLHKVLGADWQKQLISAKAV